MPRMKKNEIIRRLLQEKFELESEFREVQQTNEHLTQQHVFLANKVAEMTSKANKLQDERAHIMQLSPDIDLQLLRWKLTGEKPTTHTYAVIGEGTVIDVDIPDQDGVSFGVGFIEEDQESKRVHIRLDAKFRNSLHFWVHKP